MCFTRDLEFGKKWEKIAAEIIGGETIFAPDGQFKGWDFMANGLKYEVKADRAAYKYGSNTMFIEYECNQKSSGISTTEADIWIYFMITPTSYTVYELLVSDLKQECANCIIKCGGDGGKSRGYILTKDYFKKFELCLE